MPQIQLETGIRIFAPDFPLKVANSGLY